MANTTEGCRFAKQTECKLNALTRCVDNAADDIRAHTRAHPDRCTRHQRVTPNAHRHPPPPPPLGGLGCVGLSGLSHTHTHSECALLMTLRHCVPGASSGGICVDSCSSVRGRVDGDDDSVCARARARSCACRGAHRERARAGVLLQLHVREIGRNLNARAFASAHAIAK